jgi:abortive infection bacteriophage resistance protein
MKYTKPALTYEQQAQRLLDRGLIADKKILVDRLKVVNYYRLSAYWYNFDVIWRRYTFDRELHLLIMDAIEHVEVAILRTRLVSQFSLAHGPFGYVDIANFNPRFSSVNHARLLSELDTAIRTSNEEFIGRFQRKYTSESHLPIWIAVEVMTFGQLFTMFRNLDRSDLQPIAREFNLYPPVLVSWLHTLLFIRNTCAHHARLWNREIPIRPQIPDRKHKPEWHSPVQFNNTRVFTVLSLLRYLLRFIEPHTDWQSRLDGLLLTYPEIPLDAMGFPQNWKDSSIWK